MDPLAHTLVGAGLAETGLKKKSALATAGLVIGANLPDIDVIAWPMGRDTMLYWRRGWSHGVLALALLPLVLWGMLWLWDRWRRSRDPDRPPARFGVLLGLIYLATLTHPVLDWLNTYGIRLLMPFDGRWFYGDILFIIDPWVWLLAGSTVVLAHSRTRFSAASWILLGLATSTLVLMTDRVPIPCKVVWVLGLVIIVAVRLRDPEPRSRRRLAAATLLTVVAYIVAMGAGSSYAEHLTEDRLAEQGLPHRVIMAGPVAANPFVRDVIAANDEEYRFYRVDVARGTLETGARAMPRGRGNPEVWAAARRAPGVRGLMTWIRFPAWRVDETDEGFEVHIRDVRYSRRRGTGLGSATVVLNANLEPVRVIF